MLASSRRTGGRGAHGERAESTAAGQRHAGGSCGSGGRSSRYIGVPARGSSRDLLGATDHVRPRSASTRRRSAPWAAVRAPLLPGSAHRLVARFCGLRARVVEPDVRQGRRALYFAWIGDTAAVSATSPSILQISGKTPPPREKTAGHRHRYTLSQRRVDPSPGPYRSAHGHFWDQ